MCADICAAPEDTTMTCDDCKMGIQARKTRPSHCHNLQKKIQAAIDQLLSEAAMDAIVEAIAPIICQDNPTEECPAAVDVIIRQGIPALVAAGSDGDFGQVLLLTIDDVSMRPDSGWKMALELLVLD